MSRLARAVAGAVAGVAVVLAGCTTTVDGRPSAADPSSSGGGSSAAAGAQPAARFTDCTADYRLDALPYQGGRRSRISIGCADVPVPLDHADPSKGTIDIHLVRVHDSANPGHRPLLLDPGGPGVAGSDYAVSLSASVSDAVLRTYDLVGLDPRGVGESAPVTCLTDAQKDAYNAASPDVLTEQGFQQAKAQARQLADACEARNGRTLEHIDTEATARDLDRLRQALGRPTLDYLGFSYGTELGAQFAHLFPSKVGRMVLDGAVDPLADDITSVANQLQGFEDAFDQFAQFCVKDATCRTIGDPRQAVYDLAARARKDPLRSSAPGETRRVTYSLLLTGVLQALYSRSLWPTLGEALRQGVDGDGRPLLALADQYNERTAGRYTNVTDANTTISCNDARPGPSDATVRATAREWSRKYPLFGLWTAPSLLTCQQWQPDRDPPPLPTAKTSATTVLVVGNLHDPATPYQGAKNLTRTMGRARLLTWDGEGHTSYLQGSTCVDRAVDAYLVSGTLPASGTTCR